MRGLVSILMIAILFASCKQKKYTPEQLEKAKWDSLSPGIYHISIKTGTVLATDAIEINFPDTSFKNVPLEISNELLTLVLEKVKKTLHNSRAGYLKVNFPNMLRPDTIKAMVYLTDDYDNTLQVRRDSTTLLYIPGIQEVHYVSKEMAARQFQKEDSSQWETILADNPLPSSFEITLATKDWDTLPIENLKRDIFKQVARAYDVTYPAILYNKTSGYFVLEYTFR